jgi:hypothetical protein
MTSYAKWSKWHDIEATKRTDDKETEIELSAAVGNGDLILILPNGVNLIIEMADLLKVMSRSPTNLAKK